MNRVELENIKKTQFFKNKEDFLYYRNLFIRYLKSTSIYDKVKNYFINIDKLDEKLKCLPPEHYLTALETHIRFNDLILNYLIFISDNVLEKHRKCAIDLAYDEIIDRNIDFSRLDEVIKYHRNNCGFSSFIGTKFDDEHIKSFYDLTKNSPPILIFFYLSRNLNIPGIINNDEFKQLIEEWMYVTSRKFYNC